MNNEDINKFNNLSINENNNNDENNNENYIFEDSEEEEPEYINTFEYIQTLRILLNHNRFITLKQVNEIDYKLFIKYFYKEEYNEEELFDKYLNINEILSKKLQKNIISEINAFLDYKDKIHLILLPEFIFKKYNSPFEKNKKLKKLNNMFKSEFTKNDFYYIDKLVLKRVIFNLYMYKFNLIKYKNNKLFIIPKI